MNEASLNKDIGPEGFEETNNVLIPINSEGARIETLLFEGKKESVEIFGR